jgi:hypothetical protein
MRFKLYTLIDITATGARRGDDPILVKQQQNYLTVIQTIGIRANPEIGHNPTMQTMQLNKLNFGSEFKGTKNVWVLDFEFGLNQTHTVDLLESDFDLVPVIGELTETVKPEDWVFRTTDPKHKNIYFVLDT